MQNQNNPNWLPLPPTLWNCSSSGNFFTYIDNSVYKQPQNILPKGMCFALLWIFLFSFSFVLDCASTCWISIRFFPEKISMLQQKEDPSIKWIPSTWKSEILLPICPRYKLIWKQKWPNVKKCFHRSLILSNVTSSIQQCQLN